MIHGFDSRHPLQPSRDARKGLRFGRAGQLCMTTMSDSTESAKAAPLKSSAKGAQDESGLYPGHFVYVLRSLSNPRRTYTGRTNQPKQRLKEHNGGDCPHTSKFVPWKVETLVGFTSLEKAVAFERYLKSGSGRAFSKSHFG